MLSPEQRRLWTVGYQGRAPEEFVGALTGAGVELIVDARWRAASHRPWFGRRALERLLAGAGVGYAHAPLLGVPADVRRAYLVCGDVDGLLRHYRETILPAARDEVERVAALAMGARVALLCFERDPRACHRSVLAEAVAAAMGGAEVVHL